MAREAESIAAHNAEAAVRGGQVIGNVIATMQDIHASSSKISDIIGVIDGIAFQTNILALKRGGRGGACRGPGDGALPWLPPRCARWRSARPPRPARSRI